MTDYRDILKNLNDAGFVRTIPLFKDHVLPHGLMPDEMGAHACWMYATGAHQMIHEIEAGAQYEGELDHINMLNNLARSVSAWYKLESPSELVKYMEICKFEAMRSDYPWDSRVERPNILTFIR